MDARSRVTAAGTRAACKRRPALNTCTRKDVRWRCISFLHGACVRIWSLHANGSMAACRFAIGWHGACPGGVQESQDGSWERLSLQRIHCGTGELCSGRGLRNATEDSLIRVSSSALGQRLRSAPADFDPRRRFASVHSASDSTPTHCSSGPFYRRRLDIGPHFNQFDSGGDGRYGRISTFRSQAQDRWSVSQPAKGGF